MLSSKFFVERNLHKSETDVRANYAQPRKIMAKNSNMKPNTVDILKYIDKDIIVPDEKKYRSKHVEEADLLNGFSKGWNKDVAEERKKKLFKMIPKASMIVCIYFLSYNVTFYVTTHSK